MDEQDGKATEQLDHVQPTGEDQAHQGAQARMEGALEPAMNRRHYSMIYCTVKLISKLKMMVIKMEVKNLIVIFKKNKKRFARYKNLWKFLNFEF